MRLIIQIIESNILTPFIQSKQVGVYAQMYTNLLGFFFIVVTIAYLLITFGKKLKSK